MAFDFPLLPLEALLRGNIASDPCAVADAGEVIACNAAARVHGVRSGMGLVTARALAPALRVRMRDESLERAALEAAAIRACRYTPRVSLEPPRAVLAEVEGSLRLFGGAASLLAQLRSDFAELGFSAAAAVAPAARAALWLARGEGGRLETLPVTVMEAGTEALELLDSLGVRTIGELLALPRDGVARRFDRKLLDELDQAFGRLAEVRSFFVLPERFAVRLELGGEVWDAEAVLFTARRLLLQMEDFLAVRHAGVRRFVLTLLGRDAQPLEIAVGLAAPGRDAARFTPLLRERLAAVTLAAPVDAIRLEAGELVPLPGRSGALFQDGYAENEAWFGLLERLQARLGADAVHGLSAHPEHRPEHAWRRIAADARPVQVPGSSGPRPLWLLEPPRRLHGMEDAERGGAAFALLAGPERIESGWWDGNEARRDYFIARGADSSLVWIYRDGDAWFLHGIFA